MIIDGKDYYAVDEENSDDCCEGCAFIRSDKCEKARETVNCGELKIIWKKAEPTAAAKALNILKQQEKQQLEGKQGHHSSFTASEREHLEKYPHYYRDIRHINILDIYRVLDLFSTGDSALDHATKKILAAGKRGAKDKEKDIKEAIDTLTRRLEMLEEDKRCS